MSARDEMLSRVRRAQAVGPVTGGGAVPRDYRRAGDGVPTTDELARLLTDRLRGLPGRSHRGDGSRSSAAIADVLGRHGARHVVLPDGLPERLVPTGIDVVSDDPSLTAGELDDVDAVVTTSAVAIAETGTIVLDAGREWAVGRSPSCRTSTCWWSVGRHRPGVPEALTRLDPTRPLTWISGPSATSDIELDRVEGVHGPRRLEVVLVD